MAAQAPTVAPREGRPPPARPACLHTHCLPRASILQDGQLCLTDLATLSSAGRVGQEHGDAVTSVASCSAREHQVFASVGQSVLTLDLRKVTEEKGSGGATRAARISTCVG